MTETRLTWWLVDTHGRFISYFFYGIFNKSSSSLARPSWSSRQNGGSQHDTRAKFDNWLAVPSLDWNISALDFVTQRTTTTTINTTRLWERGGWWRVRSDEIKKKNIWRFASKFLNASGVRITCSWWGAQAEGSWVCLFGSQVEMKCVDPDVEISTWCDCVFRYCRQLLCVKGS